MISVIVPVYNVEPYLHQCVDSILAQTYTDFELILVDDGSPDNCGAICDEYAEKDSRIRVIHQKNGGLSAARNAGIDAARGEYLAFVDSDDWVHPEMLRLLHQAICQTGLQISACSFLRTHEREVVIEPVKLDIIELDGASFYASEKNVEACIACNKLYKRELFCKIRYPEGRTHEDEFVTYKLLYWAGKVAYIPAKMYFYYQNAQGIMGRPYSTERLNAVKAFEEQAAFFRNKQRPEVLRYARLKFIRESIGHILKLETEEKWKPYAQKVKRRVQPRIILWGPSIGMNPLKNKWEYSIIFPRMYDFYKWLRNLARFITGRE